MNCETFKMNIDALIDGEIGREQRLEMEAHAKECPACREELEQAKLLMEMCAELSEVSVPLSAQAAWRKAVRREADKKRKPMGSWMRGIASVAAAMVVLVTGTYGMRMSDTAPVLAGQTIRLAEAGQYETMNAAGDSDRWGVAPLNYDPIGSYLQSDGSMGETRSLTTSGDAAQTEVVVLRSAARSIESGSYDSDVQWLNDLVSEYDAWFEERSETAATADGTAGRMAKAVIRVPDERLDDFLMELDQLGNTLMRSEAAEDVTGRYMDTQSRLDALKLQKSKLDEMMASTASVEELIAIDDKLTEVIASMEALEGDLRRWESLRSYARVELTLTELVRKPAEASVSLGMRMKQGFDESVEWLSSFGQDALVTLAAALPRLVVFVPAIALVIVLIWAIRAKKRK